MGRGTGSGVVSGVVFPRRNETHHLAGSAAFQAAGIAEAPIRGYRLALPPAGTRGSRQDAGAPSLVGTEALTAGCASLSRPTRLRLPLQKGVVKAPLPLGGSRKRGTARRVPMNPFHLIMLVRPHLLRPTSRCRDWVARNRDRDRNRNFDCDPDLGFYDTLTGRGVGERGSKGEIGAFCDTLSPVGA